FPLVRATEKGTAIIVADKIAYEIVERKGKSTKELDPKTQAKLETTIKNALSENGDALAIIQNSKIPKTILYYTLEDHFNGKFEEQFKYKVQEALYKMLGWFAKANNSSIESSDNKDCTKPIEFSIGSYKIKTAIKRGPFFTPYKTSLLTLEQLLEENDMTQDHLYIINEEENKETDENRIRAWKEWLNGKPAEFPLNLAITDYIYSKVMSKEALAQKIISVIQPLFDIVGLPENSELIEFQLEHDLTKSLPEGIQYFLYNLKDFKEGFYNEVKRSIAKDEQRYLNWNRTKIENYLDEEYKKRTPSIVGKFRTKAIELLIQELMKNFLKEELSFYALNNSPSDLVVWKDGDKGYKRIISLAPSGYASEMSESTDLMTWISTNKLVKTIGDLETEARIREEFYKQYNKRYNLDLTQTLSVEGPDENKVKEYFKKFALIKIPFNFST
ncbi:MAG: hypothetical protein QW625_02585, partial [Candidatus Nanoarchaeia archaeon]